MRAAVLSGCERYRYQLDREMGHDERILVFVMLNPSTADAEVDDPTIRKCKGFAKRLGYCRIRVVNLFAWRATKPTELSKVDDPVGPDNDDYVRIALSAAHRVIVAWGTTKIARKRMARLVELAPPWLQMQCLGTNKDGSPRHPLMLPYSTTLQNWDLWPYGPPSHHEEVCHLNATEGIGYCDCKASDASDTEWGIGA